MSEAEDLMNKCCLSKCRGHALEAENKRQADFLSLAKEQMDASQVEKRLLGKALEKYGTHLGDCSGSYEYEGHKKLCHCGYEQALKGK